MNFQSSAVDGIATKLVSLTEQGALFMTEPHPDRLDSMVVCWDAIKLIHANWDRASDLIQNFDTGGRLYIPRHLVAQLCLEVNYYG